MQAERKKGLCIGCWSKKIFIEPDDERLDGYGRIPDLEGDQLEHALQSVRHDVMRVLVKNGPTSEWVLTKLTAYPNETLREALCGHADFEETALRTWGIKEKK